jgi:hypothetical protein
VVLLEGFSLCFLCFEGRKQTAVLHAANDSEFRVRGATYPVHNQACISTPHYA